jgi:uncharacterized membrane protein YkvI
MFEMNRLFQRQVDLLRKDTRSYQLPAMFSMLLMLISMHYLIFIDSWPAHLVPKVILTIMLICSILYVFHQTKVREECLHESLKQEKRNMKAVKKHLSNFNSRIISSVRASPASFARILTNEMLYRDFRFDAHSRTAPPEDRGDKSNYHE